MAGRDPDRLKSYFELITRRRGGAAALLEQLGTLGAGQRGGLEGLDAGPSPEAVRGGLEAVSRGAVPAAEQSLGLEAVIYADLRPAVDVVEGQFTVSHPLWTHLGNPPLRARIEAVLPRIGRIELPGHPRIPYGGTGFVAGDGLVMTNRHVAELFASGLGDRNLRFIEGGHAGVDFLRERGRPAGPVLAVRRVRMVHPYWDMAVLEVEGLQDRKPLPLSLLDARDLAGREIFVVGYPAFDPRNPADVQRQLFGTEYGIKRLQPGELHGGAATSSFGKTVTAATHDCSTLGGNSGSAVVDLQTGEVLALHFGGVYQDRNYCVPTHAMSCDQRIVDAGVQFGGTPTGGPNDWAAWWGRADGAEAPGPGGAAAVTPQPVPISTVAPAPAPAPSSVTVVVPLRITIEVGAVQHASPAGCRDAARLAGATPREAGTERAATPVHDGGYASRPGYRADFLGVAPAPMPEASDPSVLAQTVAGQAVLHYQNFSIRMHARRRLALVCASNVTGEPALRRPEAGADYTRAGLGGLGPGDTERWFPDPRLDSRHQLPDVFFTRDGGAFDKGHIVRRDDVAWGETYGALRRANGDTFHATNCSPQVAGFNRPASGGQNWGDLEAAVLPAAASERLCVFAGPVLDPQDPVFLGVGDGRAPLRVQIPRRFWKVVVARVDAGLAAFGFVLEQDLADGTLEFTVPPEFRVSMVPLAGIARMAGVSFASGVLDADQAGRPLGAHVAARAGAPRDPDTDADTDGARNG